ncbi:MAG: cytochrome c biogenesis protein CcsA [Gammaproteobacteria bacterium]|nr:cytochrome c biogenesis protein CcsA [Gammaproteobacteria bacterium]
MMNNILIGIATCSFYGISWLLLMLRLRDTRSTYTPGMGRTALFPACLGALFHVGLLTELLIMPTGLSFSFAYSLSLFTWVSVVIILLMSWRANVETLNLLSLPIAILSIVLAVLTPVHQNHVTHLNPQLEIHIIISIIAYCVLTVAALLAILLAIQDKQLHEHRISRFVQTLPALVTMENLLFKVIESGFVLLTLALITGFAYTSNWFNHKIIFSVIAWLVFLCLLLGRHIAGWRGKIAIRWTLGGFMLLMLAFFGSKFVLEIILHRS